MVLPPLVRALRSVRRLLVRLLLAQPLLVRLRSEQQSTSSIV